MKYICFGYYDKDKFDGMTEGDRNALFDTCFESTTIFAPMGIGLVEKRFSFRKLL